MKSYFFFRNDDVRSSLDDQLVELTELFINAGIPISHAVEPANVSDEVVQWLIEKKQRHPELIEIIQHGYDHSLNVLIEANKKIYKGEFGGNQSYSFQHTRIKNGMNIMNEKFGDLWFKAFCFPFGGRNEESIKVLSDLGFKVVNGSQDYTLKSSIFYAIGRALQREYLLGRKISWNLKHRYDGRIFQIDTSISIIKKFIDDKMNGAYYTYDELIHLITLYSSRRKANGIVFHHRYHTDDTNQLIRNLLLAIKNNNSITPVTLSTLYDTWISD